MLDWLIPLFRPAFWFNSQPPPLVPVTMYVLLVLTLSPLVGWWLVRARARMTDDKLWRRAWRQLQGCLLSFSLTGLILYFLAWQRVPFLSLRFFWVIWFIAHAGWGYALWSATKRDIPAMQAARAKREAYEKWLPKAKKRSS